MPHSWTFILTAIVTLFSIAAASERCRVVISNGTIVGLAAWISQRPVCQFLAIPFAEPPTGPRRFSRPYFLRHPWRHPLDVATPPPGCPQLPVSRAKWPSQWPVLESEDCLFLNIWSPAGALLGKKKAVMIWIHSGAFVRGASLPLYNGSALAALGNVVVVTIQYRLGIFGFLDGNWGLWDQHLALRWVHENIGAFGGDPASATIFGASSGGASVSLHLLSPASRPLFRRAIAQSGAATNPGHFNPNAGAIAAAARWLAVSELGCPPQTKDGAILDCLRRVPWRLLAAVQRNFEARYPQWMIWRPMLDGDFIPAVPSEADLHPKPLLIGVNGDEGAIFVDQIRLRLFGERYPVDHDDLQRFLSATFPHQPHFPQATAQVTLRRLLQHVLQGGAPMRSLSELYAHFYYLCGASRLARWHSQRGFSTFFYEFHHRASFSPRPAWMGAVHGDEMLFVFALPFSQASKFCATPAEQRLSKAIVREWVTFAKTGRPFSRSWRQFSADQPAAWRLGADARNLTCKPAVCALWSAG